MTYVISGATGFIGRAVIDLLLARGDRVIAPINPNSTRQQALAAQGGLVLLPLGLSDYATYEPQERADVFLHLAWAKTSADSRDDVSAQLDNIAWTIDAVRLAARFGCKAFVGAGSQAEYGRAETALSATTPTDPQSGYGIAKYAAGKLSRLEAARLGMRHCWARILSIYGKGDSEKTLISYLVRTLREGQSPELTACEQIWDYLHVTDAAAALVAIADRGVDGKVYPVGSGEGRRLRAYVEELRDVIAPGVRINFGARPYYPHQPMLLTADIRELTADTGFVPRVCFAEGVRNL